MNKEEENLDRKDEEMSMSWGDVGLDLESTAQTAVYDDELDKPGGSEFCNSVGRNGNAYTFTDAQCGSLHKYMCEILLIE